MYRKTRLAPAAGRRIRAGARGTSRIGLCASPAERRPDPDRSRRRGGVGRGAVLRSGHPGHSAAERSTRSCRRIPTCRSRSSNRCRRSRPLSRSAAPKSSIFVARVYAAKFTEAELKELLVFYRSTIGKKFVAEQPAVLEEGFRRTQEWSAKISEDDRLGAARGNEEARSQYLSAIEFRALRRNCMAEYDVDLFIIGAGSGRRARGAHCRRARRPRHGRRGIPRRRHLRDPRLHPEEAARLCQPLPPRVRGRRRISAGRSATRTSIGRP